MRTPEARRTTREHVAGPAAVIMVIVTVATFFYLRNDRYNDQIGRLQSQQATDVAKIDQLERQVDRITTSMNKLSTGIEHVSTLLEGLENGKSGIHR